jgi:hypothetical protein
MTFVDCNGIFAPAMEKNLPKVSRLEDSYKEPREQKLAGKSHLNSRHISIDIQANFESSYSPDSSTSSHHLSPLSPDTKMSATTAKTLGGKVALGKSCLLLYHSPLRNTNTSQ